MKPCNLSLSLYLRAEPPPPPRLRRTKAKEVSGVDKGVSPSPNTNRTPKPGGAEPGVTGARKPPPDMGVYGAVRGVAAVGVALLLLPVLPPLPWCANDTGGSWRLRSWGGRKEKKNKCRVRCRAMYIKHMV